MSDIAYVDSIPLCSLPTAHQIRPVDAEYDALIPALGVWGYICQAHFEWYGCSLGTGKGQRLVLGEEPERSDDDIRSALQEAIESGDYEAFEDACGDRDPMEFL